MESGNVSRSEGHDNVNNNEQKKEHDKVNNNEQNKEHDKVNNNEQNKEHDKVNNNEQNKEHDKVNNNKQKLPYPKSIFFILSNEFCESFTYYGIRAVWVLYLSRELNYSTDTAVVIFNICDIGLYCFCILGAIISDSWWGKFKTIFYLSIVYVCGTILITLGAIPALNLLATSFTMIGLALIALGSGSIKPCIPAFGGDQFKLPEQAKQMSTYFFLFYFCISAGSLLSKIITPVLRQDVHCFHQKECYSLAFGVPAVMMASAVVVLVLGKPFYKIKLPTDNILVLVSKTIGNAIVTQWREKKTNPRKHWLDYADKQHHKKLIKDVKVLMRMLVLYLPLPLFWASFYWQASRWAFQATRMKGNMGSWDIKSDHMEHLRPLMMLVFIPLYDVALYPALSMIGIRRPLQKMTFSGILAVFAFIIAGIVELNLEEADVLPTPNRAQVRIFNAENCAYTFQSNLPGANEIYLDAYAYYVHKNVPITNGHFNIEYSITSKDLNCRIFLPDSHKIVPNEANTLFLSAAKRHNLWFTEYVKKPHWGNPYARTLINGNRLRTVSWQLAKNGVIVYEALSYKSLLRQRYPGKYTIFIDKVKVIDFTLKIGGVYTILITELSSEKYHGKLIQHAKLYSVHMLWLIPQYVFMTLGEVMFSVSGLEFSYSQAPLSMKSVLTSCWLLTMGIGKIIVVIITKLTLFDSQASEFFLFAGLMFLDVLLFMFLAYRYKPNNPNNPPQ